MRLTFKRHSHKASGVEDERQRQVMVMLDQEWYTTEELARIVKVDPSTIRRWRTAHPRQGPPFVRLSFGVVRYSPADVQEWLKNRRIDPGDEAR